jgi:hypothetical protein
MLRNKQFMLGSLNGKLYETEALLTTNTALLWGPPLWSRGQSFWLQIHRSQVRFPALTDFTSSHECGTESTQTRENI